MKTALTLSLVLLVNLVLLALFHWLAPEGNPIVNVLLGTADLRTKDAALLLMLMLGFLNSLTLAALNVLGGADDLLASK